LELHPEKTFIRHFSSEGVFFLGVKVGPTIQKNNPIVLKKRVGQKSRVPARLPITLDLPKMFSKLKDRGFVKFDPNLNCYNGIPCSRVQNLDIRDIIKYYNRVFRGIWSYYRFVDNPKRLSQLWWRLQSSLICTISLKNRLKHGFKKTIAQYG
jgi:hypothetical protein